MTNCLSNLDEIIQAKGHAIGHTTATINHRDVSLGYTVGLADKGLPELVVFGLPAQALTILNEAATLLQQGELPLDQPIDALSNLPLIFKKAPAHALTEYICQANYRAGRHLDALQMFWPDREGVFPWVPGFDPAMAGVQPLLYHASH